MDEYTILKKKRKKNGFASTALLISIAIALIAMVGAVLVLNKVNTNNLITSDEESTVGELVSDKDTTCEGFNKEVVFNDNLKIIKEAAISYFTNERLPQKVGENVTMTLKQMKSLKLVRNVLDASGKSCSGEDSYVEVTKEENEYIMKIFLSCSNMEDYILVHLGCYDYCDRDVCEKKEKTYEYEYKKTISCEMSDWSNWGEWKIKREKTSNLKKEDTKVETTTKEVVDTKDATKGTVGYNCNKYPGYTLMGDKCVKDEKKKEVIDATKNSGGYSCPSGYTLNGTKCERMVSKTSTTKGSYICPSGYTLSGTTCTKPTSSTSTASGSYVCPSDYTLSGSTCSKTTTSKDVVNATPVYDTKYITVQVGCKKQECTTKTVFSCPTGKPCGNYPQTSCQYVQSTCPKEEPVSYISAHKCSSGYTYVSQDNTCYKETSSTDTKNATFTCPSGYTVSGTTCVKTTSGTDTKNATFTCPSGYTVSGTTCTKTYQEKEIINATQGGTTYTCKSGYTLNGTKCEKTVVVRDTKNATKVPGDYTCPSGYKLDGTKCKKTVTKEVKTTYYRYATRTCNGGSTSYEWSTSKNDSILIAEGYKLTGKKREITVNK